MSHTANLAYLERWCRSHRSTTTALCTTDGALALVVCPEDASGFCLQDRDGNTLAAASDLRALLDAVEGGVTDPTQAIGSKAFFFEKKNQKTFIR